MDNGEAKVKDFLLPEYEDVILPSGLPARLQPPNRLEFYLLVGSLPGRLAAALSREERVKLEGEDLVEWTWRVISKIFISPRFSLNPGPGEYHPNRLHDEDITFLVKWSNKYLIPGGGGADLETFREGVPGSTVAPGSGGGDVAMPPEPIDQGDGGGVGN